MDLISIRFAFLINFQHQCLKFYPSGPKGQFDPAPWQTSFTMTTLSNIQASDLNSLVHPYTQLKALQDTGPTIFERGQGVYIWDTEGKKYLEGMGGLWCTALGYGNEEMIEAAQFQMRQLSFSHLFGGKGHEPAIALADKLKEISPAPASKIFYTCSGSEANDTQIKLIWYYNNARGLTKKKKIVSRQRAYHGVTIMSASLTGLPGNHANFDLPVDGIMHTDCPHYYRGAEAGETEEEFSSRLAQNLDDMIQREDPDTIAAFIAEPVMGAGGVITPPAGYFEKIQAVLEKYDILLIVDEVICGFGRTGNMFGSETYDIRPDTISMAKALTSAYAPLGAITVTEDMYQAFVDESTRIGTFGHGFTYSGHPLGCALGVKALEIYENIDIVGKARAITPLFQKRLGELGEHPVVGEARGVGAIGGVELVANKTDKTPFEPMGIVGAKAAAFCQEEGLILRNIVDTLAICPPLIITEDEVNELFDSLKRALDKTDAWVKTDMS